MPNSLIHRPLTRRLLLAQVGSAGLAMAAKPAWGQGMIDLPLPAGPGGRSITTAFPLQGPKILQRTCPPLLKGMDDPVVAEAPHFMKSLDIDHARDGEVMIAYAMNGEQLPLVNGFPLRLVVPGWYATYWIKMLNDIEVLDQPDTNYWTKTAYTIPDTPHADIKPGETNVKMVPINRMVPRSFVTNIASGQQVKVGASTLARGIAFGGDCGVARVDYSADGGKSWQQAQLG